MPMGTVAANILQQSREQAVNKVQQGLQNRHRILQVVREFPAVTASLINSPYAESCRGVRVRKVENAEWSAVR